MEDTATLKLVEAKTLDTGTLILTYHPAD
jgi:hypothetical protein